MYKPIAVIGMSCRFAGGAHNIDSYWDLLINGEDAIIEVPTDRWSLDRYFDRDRNKPGKIDVSQGGFLQTDITAFDANFFGISPREAEILDPQQRLLLELVWESFEHAGIPPMEARGTSIGVFIGSLTQDNQIIQLSYQNRESMTQHTAGSSSMTMLSNRISYIFDLRGPSFTVDTACSSSMVALHQACRALQNGDCELAIVGGVNIMLRPEYMMLLGKGGFLAPDAHCKAFDAAADGYGRGEGAGILLLKPLDDALEDGDEVHAVIKASAVNQDGQTQGISSPNSEAQKALLQEVLDRAGLSGEKIQYVEAHGTGTQAGDTAEANSIGTVIGSGHSDSNPLWVGSVKTNIGHTEAAAGVASIIKTILAMRNRTIPPHRNFSQPNPKFDLNALNINLPLEPTPWPDQSQTASAIVNSFGYGGTNGMVLLQSPPHSPPKQSTENRQLPTTMPYGLIPVSARSERSLANLADQYRDWIIHANGNGWLDLAYTASARRDHHAYRATVAYEHPGEIPEKLEQLGSTTTFLPGIIRGQFFGSDNRKVAFIYTGMGPQWWGMGRELLERSTTFRQILERCDLIWKELSGWSLFELFSQQTEEPMDEPIHAQPANFVLQIALTEELTQQGLHPSGILGHSVGEVATAYIAGVLSLEKALQLIYHRSRLQQQTMGQGKMLAVGLSKEDVTSLLPSYDEKISLAAINSPNSVTLAGEKTALLQISNQLDAQQIFNRLLRVEVAYHSHQMAPLEEQFKVALSDQKPSIPTIDLYSTVTGQRVTGETGGVDYWWQNARAPVQFSQAFENLLKAGFEAFIEIGPHPVLSGVIREIMDSQGIDGITVAAQRRKMPEIQTMLTAIGELYVNGVSLNWKDRYKEGKFVHLPHYPWDRQPFMYETKEALLDRIGDHSHPFVQPIATSPTPTWEGEISLTHHPFLADHVIHEVPVFPGAALIEIGLAIAKNEGKDSAVIENLKFQRMLLTEETPKLRITLDENSGTFNIYSRQLRQKDRWNLNATGRVVSGYLEPEVEYLDLESIRARCSESISGKNFYSTTMTNRALFLGDSFRNIREYFHGDLESLACIEGDEGLGVVVGEYLIHPAILDASFHTLLQLTDLAQSDITYVPVQAYQIRLHHPLPKEVWCYSRVVESNEDYLTGNIILTDNRGSVLAEVIGMRFEPLHQDLSIHQVQPADWFYKSEWIEADNISLPEEISQGRWFVCSDAQGYADELICQLDELNQKHIRINHGSKVTKDNASSFKGNLTKKNHLKELVQVEDLQSLTGVVFFWSPAYEQDYPDQPDIGLGNTTALVNLANYLNEHAPVGTKLAVVTVGSQHVEPDDHLQDIGQHALWGSARAIENECENLKLRLIDLEGRDFEDKTKFLVAELFHECDLLEIALRGSKRFTLKLNLWNVPESQSQQTSLNVPVALYVKNPGQIDSLEYRQITRVAPKSDEVEIEVHSFPLNFKDVMKVMGLLPDDYLVDSYFGKGLGLECAGVITRVGSRVTRFRVGDEVVMPISTYGVQSYITGPEAHVMPKPSPLSMAESAVFINWIAPYYGLKYVARLMPGDKILIHSAAGAVGLAAIQISRWRNAEIYATAGNNEKREYLKSIGVKYVSDSRSLQFVNDVKDWTKRKGVDVVLNSLSGEALWQSFNLLAPYGRFIEIGKRDILDNQPLAMAAFGRNQTFSAVDTDIMLADNPKLFLQMYHEVWHLFEDGVFSAMPTKTYPASEIKEAFRDFSQAKHIGKIVVDFKDQMVMAHPAKESLADKIHQGSMLITGAFGGFGIELVRWLVQQGAQNLVLVSRRGPISMAADQMVADLKSSGVHFVIKQVDLSKSDSVKGLIDEVRTTLPPLKGIFHAAGVVDDMAIGSLDAAAIQWVMAPKAAGAWFLHENTLDLDLDYFVLFSSVSAIIGNPGQINYGAANAVLDGLAHFRRSRGLHAISINWGALSEVGMVGKDKNIERHLALLGVDTYSSSQAMQALETILAHNLPQISFMNLNWFRLKQQLGKKDTWSRFEQFTSSELIANSTRYPLRHELNELPSEQQAAFIETHLIEHIAQITRNNIEQIPTSAGLDRLGIDSLMAVELISALRMSLGVEINQMKVMQGITISALAEEIHSEIFGSDDEIFDQIDEMTEDELDALLQELEVETLD